ncbi:MAG TPA: hypothetical protein VF290_22560 [Pyrinomonadaceae bacterium]
MADHLVKLVHSRDLAQWDRFPAYEEHTGKTLAQHRGEVKARKDLENQTWRLREAQSLVDGADTLKLYRTATIDSPWPISLPGRRSVLLPAPAYLNTTFEPELGRVEDERLVLPLFTKGQEVAVRYLATDNVASPDRVAKAKAELAKASEAELERLRIYLGTPKPEPVLFISHRWLSKTHPDPDGQQLRNLKALKDCYLIYDYSSFPQDTSIPAAQLALNQVLDAMNSFIDKVLVLSDPDYMNRGWCLYEYLAGALTNRIICDEVKDPALVRLRNLVATNPNPPGIDSTYREAQNAKSHLILEAVNAVLPVFNNGQFTKPEDRAIVRNLLIRQLLSTLPRKHEYMQYVGEWKTIAWTEEELAMAFAGNLKWEALQYNWTIPIFEPAVPDTVAGTVAAGFAIPEQPERFFRSGLDLLDLSGIDRIVLLIKAGLVAFILLLLGVVYFVVRWAIGV